MPDEHKQTLTTQQAIDPAVQHHKSGGLPKAESIYQQILQDDPDQPDALYFLGLIAQQVGNNDIAFDLISKALAIMPTQFMRGRVTYRLYLHMGMPDYLAHTNEESVEITMRYARNGKLGADMVEKIKKAYETSLTSLQLPTLELKSFFEGTQNLGSTHLPET